MRSRFRPTLAQAFAAAFAALLVVLGILGSAASRASRGAILAVAEQLRALEASRRADAVEQAIYRVQLSLGEVEQLAGQGLLNADDAASVERALVSELIRNPWLAEITLTRAERTGFDDEGAAIIEPRSCWQVSASRTPDAPAVLHLRHVFPGSGGFVADGHDWAPGRPAEPRREPGTVPNPANHPTFETTASRALQSQVSGAGGGLWTDLHYAESDAGRPESERMVVLSVMKALTGADGRFLGVVRAALRERQVDDAVRAGESGDDAHLIVLCDEQGRLLTRLGSADVLAEQPDGSLRVASASVPDALTRALGDPALARVRAGHLDASTRVVSEGRAFLVTYRGLGRTQGWRVVVVVPEDVYLGDFQATRSQLVAASGLALAVILFGGLVVLAAVRRGLGRIVEATGRMRGLDFAPADPDARFRDVGEVLAGLERAKTALRAMGKYVPIDLVRRLWGSGREPELGGEVLDVTLLFTDIAGFTTLAEGVEPDRLARWLGRYLEVMTGAIHAHQGTVDKYIGDAVMALWNAPSPVPDHPRRACAAALACLADVAALEASEEWRGSPSLPTRFGLHTDRVMVGHFGAPDRLAYTALGDGVNLASRLEGLNKLYGTTILASETVFAAAHGAFRFRCVDVVSVKGRSRPVRVYELLGPVDAPSPVPDAVVAAYEAAFEAYLARDFAASLERLASAGDDPPSRVLAERCRRYAQVPPPPGWDGTFVATSK